VTKTCCNGDCYEGRECPLRHPRQTFSERIAHLWRTFVKEREIENYLVRRVREVKGEVRKVKWIGRRGAPDRLVMLPAVPALTGFELVGAQPARTIWVELKAPGEKPKQHQVREHERMRAMGQHVEVVDSIEGVELLMAWGRW
jgi:hypothetical protein